MKTIRAIRGAALDALNTLCKIRHDFATEAGVEPALVFRADDVADVPTAVMGAALAVSANFTRAVRPVVAMFVDSPAGSVVLPALASVERAISGLASAAAGLRGWNFRRELDRTFEAVNALLPLLNLEAAEIEIAPTPDITHPPKRPAAEAAAAAYRWAVENLPAARAGDFKSVHRALLAVRNLPHCAEHADGVPDSPQTFARYCRAAGIKRRGGAVRGPLRSAVAFGEL